MVKNKLQQITSQTLKQFAFNKGADLVGIASIDRFHKAPARHKPTDLLPDAKTVVVCAMRIMHGVLNSQFTVYHNAMMTIHQSLDKLAFEIALFIEKSGGNAIPVPSDEPYRYWEKGNQYGRGDLSHKHVAQAAGLGRLGKNSLLITPQFGNMVHLVSVITDIKIEPDNILEKDPCSDSCRLCLENCPANAILDDRTINQLLCRKNLIKELPKGNIIENCHFCRSVCPYSKKSDHS